MAPCIVPRGRYINCLIVNSFMILKTQTITVTPEMAADRVGSGLLHVYATPMVAALMESTSILCIEDLEADETTVGVEINVQHVKATAIGEQVTCTACLKEQDERSYHFILRVENARGEEIAEGTHVRVRVNKERFMSKLSAAR